MLTKIEQYLFENNQTHLLLSLEKFENDWIVVIAPGKNKSKSFVFSNVDELWEEAVWNDNKTIAFPLDIIGFDSKKQFNGKWKFCLNTYEMEWGFISNWPKRITLND
jgi:hypothetical protein